MIKILYVDDEPINLELFKLTFRGKFDVITAESAHTALSILETNEIRIVITDMKMPGIGGLELIDKIRKKYSDIQFYILSGYEKTSLIDDAINNNIIKNYFKKPFNKILLETEIINNISK